MTLYRECFRHLYAVERRRIPPTPANELRLHRLERPEPWSEAFLSLIWSAQQPINHYPDYAKFHERVAAFAGVPKESLVLGAGIEDFIRSLMFLCCGPGEVVAFTYPTCAMFDVYAEVFGARVAHILVDPDKPFTVDDLLAQLPKEARLLILPNPGQPVENCFVQSDIRTIATHCFKQGTVLAIDEAYYGFGASTALPLVESFDNLLVLRTFSKAFGAAGIRVGYAVGRQRAIKPLDAARASGEVAGPSIAAATVLMDHWHSHVQPAIKEVCAGRDWLRETLAADEFKVRGSLANHVLIDLKSAKFASTAAARLKANGVHVKANFPAPVDRHLLVTAGSVGLMQRFVEAFREAL